MSVATDPQLVAQVESGQMSAAEYAAIMAERQRASDLAAKEQALRAATGADPALIASEIALARAAAAQAAREAAAREQARRAAEAARSAQERADIQRQTEARIRAERERAAQLAEQAKAQRRAETGRVRAPEEEGAIVAAAIEYAQAEAEYEAGNRPDNIPSNVKGTAPEVEAANASEIILTSEAVPAPDWALEAVYQTVPEEEWKSERAMWLAEQVAQGQPIPVAQATQLLSEAGVIFADDVQAPEWVYEAVYQTVPEEEWKASRGAWFAEQVASGGAIPVEQTAAFLEDWFAGRIPVSAEGDGGGDALPTYPGENGGGAGDDHGVYYPDIPEHGDGLYPTNGNDGTPPTNGNGGTPPANGDDGTSPDVIAGGLTLDSVGKKLLFGALIAVIFGVWVID